MEQNEYVFETLLLSPEVLRAAQELGYASLTPIQASAIPLILEGHDVVGRSSTGTGKTAAFGIPVVERVSRIGYGVPLGGDIDYIDELTLGYSLKGRTKI